jgi:TonB-linked SusC/RagA family outer membrane protein
LIAETYNVYKMLLQKAFKIYVMKKHFYTALLLVLCTINLIANAQQAVITGKVTDAVTGETLIGVSVRVVRGGSGTQTDLNGNFRLNTTQGDSLTFSYVGYTSQTLPVAGRTTFAIRLQPVANMLQQVVVIGYGTQRRRDVTGAVASVSGDRLARQPVQTATQALQGQVSGVQVISSGQPNALPQLRIRGTGSVLAGANPLYVVDGVLTDDIRNISSDDITSIDVLKDASAAIYGVRAANGVVIITTRKGKNGPPVIRYNASAGFQELSNKVQMASRQQYIDYLQGANPTALTADIPPLTYTGSTDWYNAVLRKGLEMNHNLSLSGGSEKTTYFLSLGEFTNNGLVKTNAFHRYTFRSNIDVKITDKLTFGTQLSYTNSKERPVAGVYTDIYRAAPVIPATDSRGLYGNTSVWGNVGNPLLSLMNANNQTNTDRVQGNIYIEFKPVKTLTLRSALNIDNLWNKLRNYTGKFRADSAIFNIAGGNQYNTFSTLFIQNDQAVHTTWDNTATWHQTFGKHDVTVLAGYTVEYQKTELFSGSRRDVPNDPDLWYLDVGNPESGAVYANNGALFKRLSYLGRINYSYNGRYLFSASLRADGSSRFSRHFGYFPTISAGWVISEESFLKDSKTISHLKLRGSWGQLGNDNIGQGLYVVTATPNLPYFFNNNLVLGTAIQDIKNTGLKWERTAQIDVGLEYGLFNNKLSGEADYYHKKVRDALTNVTIPGILGDPDQLYVTNAASYQNSGFEFSASWKDKIGKVGYSVGGNINYNRNRVIGLNGGQALIGGGVGNQSVTRTDNGQPIASYYVLEYAGVFQNQAQINAAPSYNLNGYNKTVGGLIFNDISGPGGKPDGVVDNYDRTFSGSYQPQYYGGLNLSVNYGNWDLGADFYYNWGNQIYNGKRQFRGNMNDNIEASYAQNRWTSGNPSNTDPATVPLNIPASTYFIESGAFLRLNNLTLGFVMPQSILKKLKMNRMRVYLASQNLFTAKRYSGFSPELLTTDILASGIELSNYPTTRTFAAGVNVEF